MASFLFDDTHIELNIFMEMYAAAHLINADVIESGNYKETNATESLYKDWI